MRVLLIATPIMDYVAGELEPIEMDAYRVCPPYGLYMLCAVLEAAGHEVVFADLIAAKSASIDAYADELAQVDLVGIGASSLCWPTAREVVAAIRTLAPEVPIVLGNIHATLFDTYLLERFPIDFAIRGEAERALPALCAALEGKGELAEVPNLSWRSPEGSIVRNPEGPKLTTEELLDCPLPAYERLPSMAYKSLAIESSRGCALDCSFCSTPYRRTWRGLEAERFVDRLEAVLAHAPRTREGTVHIIDDEFATNPARASAIAKLIRERGLEPGLIYDARAIDFLKGDFAESIAPLTARLLIGAECGYDEGLRKVGKGITVSILERTAARLAELGIAAKSDFSFIIGLPWETITEVRKTLRFAAHLHGNYGVRVRLNWYLHVPGSRLWDEAREAQLLNETMYDDYGNYRGLYLFRAGNRLSPKELWEVRSIVTKLQWVSAARFDEPMIDFFFPELIERYFPKSMLESSRENGLVNLRRLARPGGVESPSVGG